MIAVGKLLVVDLVVDVSIFGMFVYPHNKHCHRLLPILPQTSFSVVSRIVGVVLQSLVHHFCE